MDYWNYVWLVAGGYELEKVPLKVRERPEFEKDVERAREELLRHSIVMR